MSLLNSGRVRRARNRNFRRRGVLTLAYTRALFLRHVKLANVFHTPQNKMDSAKPFSSTMVWSGQRGGSLLDRTARCAKFLLMWPPSGPILPKIEGVRHCHFVRNHSSCQGLNNRYHSETLKSARYENVR